MDCLPEWGVIGCASAMLVWAGWFWLDAWRLCRRVRRITRQAIARQDAFWSEVNAHLVEHGRRTDDVQ